MNRIKIIDLGLYDFQDTWEKQKTEQNRLIEEKISIRNGVEPDEPLPDLIMFVEHPHVYTLGKSGDINHFLEGSGKQEETKTRLVKIDRGGDITYHGPGQIVGYPIMDLERYYRDIHRYLRDLEEVIIRVCADYHLTGERINKLTGVWVQGAKLCAFGVKCSRWVTMHGFALNVNTDLNYFSGIIPCGIPDKPVTSLQELLGREIKMEEVKTKIIHHFCEVFGVEVTT